MKTKLKSLFFFILKSTIAIGIIYWLIHSNYSDFSKVLRNIDVYWLIGAGILYLFALLASALRWLLLLRILQINVKFFEAFSLTMQGTFFSLVIPGGALGGDLVKTGFLVKRTPKGKKLEATSTIFMDRFLGMFGQFSIGVVMGIACLPLIAKMDELTKIATLLLIVLSALGLIAGVAILFHRELERIKLFAWGMNFADKMTKGFVSRIAEILDVYRKAKKTLFKCLLIGIFLIQLNICLILYFIALGINSSFVAIKPLILATSLGNTAGLLPITPTGIGTRDVIIKSILTAGGFFDGDAVAIPLLYSSLLILFSISGGLFFVLSKNKNPNKKHTT